VPDALFVDPPSDPDYPAESLPLAIPSHGVNLNAVVFTAVGAGPHPNVLLLHGLPGNEQNIDLAQSLRRAGWNVLTLHYRGSWGSPGVFSFSHCLEDAAAAIEWLRKEGADRVPRIDPGRILVIGHSMGGFVAARIVAADSGLLGAGLISGVAVGPVFGASDKDDAIPRSTRMSARAMGCTSWRGRRQRPSPKKPPPVRRPGAWKPVRRRLPGGPCC
jgi:pimeloyl-ACP methyl ester carboxylesterase